MSHRFDAEVSLGAAPERRAGQGVAGGPGVLVTPRFGADDSDSALRRNTLNREETVECQLHK